MTLPKFKKGDTLHVKVEVIEPPDGGVVRVGYGNDVGFYVDVRDVAKHEPKAIAPGDQVRHEAYPSVTWRMHVENISPDGKWAWLKTTYPDKTSGYATYPCDALIRVDEA